MGERDDWGDRLGGGLGGGVDGPSTRVIGLPLAVVEVDSVKEGGYLGQGRWKRFEAVP